MKVLAGLVISHLILSNDIIQYFLFNLFVCLIYVGQFQDFCFAKCDQTRPNTDVMCIKRGITLMQEANIYLNMTESFAQRIHLIAEFYVTRRFSSRLARGGHVT